jgi:hypothetical protein
MVLRAPEITKASWYQPTKQIERVDKEKATVLAGPSCARLTMEHYIHNGGRITARSEDKLKTRKRAPCLSFIEGRFAGKV